MQKPSTLAGCTELPETTFTPQRTRVRREMVHVANRAATHREEQVSHYCLTHQVTDMDGNGQVVVVNASGEIDCGASPQLRGLLHRHIELDTRRLVLDLSTVTFIDSTAIGVIIGATARLKAAGRGYLSVACAEENARVMRILDIAGVASQISLHRSRQEALAALSASTPAPSRWPLRATASEAHSEPCPPEPRSRLLAVRSYAQQAGALWRDQASGVGDRSDQIQINELA